jgi:hypothetical protein
MKQLLTIAVLIGIAVMPICNSCKKDEALQSPANEPPVAKAGNDLTIHIPENKVQLDGSSSFDPETYIASYTWRQISGPNVWVVKTVNASRVFIEQLKEGEFEFELKVTDPIGLAATDTVRVTVIDNFAIGKTPVLSFNCDSKLIAYPNSSTEILLSAYVENDQGTRYHLSEGFKFSQLTGPSTARINAYNYNGFTTSISVMNLTRGTYKLQMEVVRKGKSAFDTITLQVIEDTLIGKEYIFESKWQADQATGELVAKSTIRPELFYSNPFRKTNVFIKTEGEPDWYQIFDWIDDWWFEELFYFTLGPCESQLEARIVNGYFKELTGKKVQIKIHYPK